MKKAETLMDDALQSEKDEAERKEKEREELFERHGKEVEADCDMKAVKDFHINCPPHADIKIKKGDNIKTKVPKMFWKNLQTEGVILKKGAK